VIQLPSAPIEAIHNKYLLLYLYWIRLTTIKRFSKNRTA